MTLFKLSTKELVAGNGIRLEACMTREGLHNSSILPWGNSIIRTELKRQFKMKYKVDFQYGFININNFNIEKL